MTDQNRDDRQVVVLDGEAHHEPAHPVELRSAFDIQPQRFQAGLNRRKKNRDALMTWIRDSLVEGTDWGRIHVVKKEQCPDGRYCQNPYHFSKPSLWKAGAEKIAGMMGLRVAWPTLRDYEDRIIRGEPVAQILLRCELINAEGVTVAEGIGARALREDYDDLNKALKMAKKSGFIDAVLNVGGLSEVFTQDVEDMDPEKIAPGAWDPANPREEPRAEHFPQRHQKPLATHCPIGREWKGKPWEEVDDGFLNWIIQTIDDKPDLVARARKELEGRSVESQEASARRLDARIQVGGKKVGDYARELTQAKTLDQVVAIQDELPPEFEPALRSFIRTRLEELGPPVTN